jgi:hypothetical protein
MDFLNSTLIPRRLNNSKGVLGDSQEWVFFRGQARNPHKGGMIIVGCRQKNFCAFLQDINKKNNSVV